MKLNARKLDLAMAKACITTTELCEVSGVSRPSFAKIRTGRRNPKPATIGKIAKALNCDVEDLLEDN